MGAAREHVERVIELWNNGDFDKGETLMADDQVWVHPSFSLTGSEAILNRYRADLAGFPDRRINVTKWFEEGDTVVVEYGFAGTHTGPYSPVPDGGELAPTGQPMTLRGVDIYEFAMVRRPRTGPTTTGSPTRSRRALWRPCRNRNHNEHRPWKLQPSREAHPSDLIDVLGAAITTRR